MAKPHAAMNGGGAGSSRRPWATWLKTCEVWWQRAAGMDGVGHAAHARLQALVQHAREHSAVYRDAYRGLPRERVSLADLPVMHKRALMARFDAWVTDPALTLARVERFLADRAQVGEHYLDRYVIWKSSGSTGTPGIFVQDDDALAVYDSLIGVQLARADLAFACGAGMFMRGGRAALIAATGDHFASIASWQRVCRAAPHLQALGLSVLAPVEELVAQLNASSPAFLASYPTMLAVLAGERKAGRLVIDPSLVWSGGEYLSPGLQASLQRTFGCPVINEYGASECLSIAFGCREGWLHVNADWVIVEPVDADYRPTPPGRTSHTVLITNLANRIQPIIRYDLGDAVVASPGPCACGNPMPAIRVEGRCDDVIVLPGEAGHEVRVVPMALTTLVEEAAGVHRFQIAWTRPDRLALRLDSKEAGHRRGVVFHRAARALESYLHRLGVSAVDIVLDPAPPTPDARSGKLRAVVAAR